ncbi:MAG: transcription antiterminator [Anaerolineaceae bacterium]|nr:transcription antiterminator [Anaerolineaceae bacterium]
MHFVHRKLEILKELINADTYLSSESLSQKIGVSARTIRNDIKLLGRELKEQGVTINSTPGRGYGIRSSDKEKARTFLRRQNAEKITIPSLPKARIYHILKNLFFADRPVPFEELAESIFVSKSTIEKDVREVEKWLQFRNLKLTGKPAVGITVVGDEINLRYGMVNCLMSHYFDHSKASIDFPSAFMGEKELDSISEIIHSIHPTNSSFLSDRDYRQLVIFLAISLFRFRNGHQIPLAQDFFLKDTGRMELQTARKIALRIKTLLDISLPEAEVLNIAQYLTQANLFEPDQPALDAVDKYVDKELVRFVRESVAGIQEQFAISFADDIDLISELVLYLNSLLNRKKHKIGAMDSGLSEIREEYPRALEMAIAASKMIINRFQVEVNENEIGYIALYFCAALERKKTKNTKAPLKVAIICSYGAASAQLLSIKIKRYFPNLAVEGVFPVHRLHEAKQKHPDLIISTIPLIEEEIPIILVSHLLNHKDFYALQKFINQPTEMSGVFGKGEFINLFRPELFLPGIELKEQEEVIRLLSEKLFENGFVDGGFTESVLGREALFSTAIGRLVAIPHANRADSCGSQIAVGILKKPIKWGEEKVQLVFLFNLHSDSGDEFPRIFEYFYTLINTKNKIKRLIHAVDFNQFINEIR